MWWNMASAQNVVFRQGQVFVYPDKMAQKKVVVGALGSSNLHPDNIFLLTIPSFPPR